MLKLHYKGHKVLILANIVVYTGLFLTKKALKWYKSYLIEFQDNKIITINKEV